MKTTLFFSALLMSTGTFAQGSTSHPSTGAGANATDPNAMICRNHRETGSMLNRTRVCKTRAQWEAERRETRQDIDRTQANRPTYGQ